jgi:hypothetical protein
VPGFLQAWSAGKSFLDVLPVKRRASSAGLPQFSKLRNRLRMEVGRGSLEERDSTKNEENAPAHKSRGARSPWRSIIRQKNILGRENWIRVAHDVTWRVAIFRRIITFTDILIRPFGRIKQ